MKLPAGCRAAMIDLDGTLVDTLGDFVAALDLMLDELHLPRVAPAQVAGLIGKGGEHLIGSVLALGAGPTDAAFQADALARFRRHYLAVNGIHARVFAGVVEGLEGMKRRGLRLACVTNKPTAPSRDLLRVTGLAPFFEVVTGGDRYERLKPDPLPLLRTCAELDAEPQATLMIGDSVNDAAAARAAGCPVVLVTYGYNHGEPVRDIDADGYIETLAELIRD